MSIDKSALSLALSGIDRIFSERLVNRYVELKNDYLKANYSSCGTLAGRFCEVVIRYLQHRFFSGSHTPFNQHISNFESECRRIEGTPKDSGPEGIRLLIPRALVFCYSMRNKRSFGHEGDNISADKIDAITCVRIVEWILSELIRDINAISLEEAQAMINSVSQKEIPFIWEVMGKTRVLDNHLNYSEQVLIILYSRDEPVLLEDLQEWTDNPNKSNFIERNIKPLHKERLIEYDKELNAVAISPKGLKYVEEKIIPTIHQ